MFLSSMHYQEQQTRSSEFMSARYLCILGRGSAPSITSRLVTFDEDSSSLPPELARISSNEAFGGALASSASSSSPLSSSDFGDLAPLGVDVPKRVGPVENEPKASFGFGTDALRADGVPNAVGVPGAVDPKVDPEGVGDAREAAPR